MLFRLALFILTLMWATTGVAASNDLAVVLVSKGVDEPLKTWSGEEMNLKIRKYSRRENDPANGKSAHWDGVLVSDLIEKSVSGLQFDRKAQIDLVIFRNHDGRQVLIPRYFITRYPVILAQRRDGKELGGWESVAPWTSEPKTASEELPLRDFFLSDVAEMRLANYREQFGSLLLEHPGDPTVARGEKIFLKNCVTCHATRNGTPVSGILVERNGFSHTDVPGMPKLGDRDRRAVSAYLGAYAQAHSVVPSPGPSPSPSTAR